MARRRARQAGARAQRAPDGSIGMGRPSQPSRPKNDTLLPLLSLSSSAPHCTSEYLLVMQEPSASMTGADVKFSDAMSSMPFL